VQQTVQQQKQNKTKQKKQKTEQQQHKRNKQHQNGFDPVRKDRYLVSCRNPILIQY